MSFGTSGRGTLNSPMMTSRMRNCACPRSTRSKVPPMMMVSRRLSAPASGPRIDAPAEVLQRRAPPSRTSCRPTTATAAPLADAGSCCANGSHEERRQFARFERDHRAARTAQLSVRASVLHRRDTTIPIGCQRGGREAARRRGAHAVGRVRRARRQACRPVPRAVGSGAAVPPPPGRAGAATSTAAPVSPAQAAHVSPSSGRAPSGAGKSVASRASAKASRPATRWRVAGLTRRRGATVAGAGQRSRRMHERHGPGRCIAAGHGCRPAGRRTAQARLHSPTLKSDVVARLRPFPPAPAARWPD